MFSICSGESVDIQPALQVKRPMKDAVIQTDQMFSETQDTQFPEKQGKKIQTDVERKKDVQTAEFSLDSLHEFLNRVTPTICDYLERNIRSHAFDRYKLLSDIESTETHKLYSLKSKLSDNQFLCADVTWNITGSSLAVAYSSTKDTDWCEHDSLVAVWNVHRKDFDPEKPSTTIETDCCVTSIAFHLHSPALLAGGKFNGGICVWNVAKEDDMLVASTESTHGSHREPITGILWSPEDKKKLISCSLDGKILVWKFQEKKNTLDLVDGFVLLAENHARNLGIKSVRPDAEIGITSMSLNCEDPSIFIVGTEGGGIFQCSFHSKVGVPFSPSHSIPMKSPVTMSFQKHTGHVTSVQFSPFSRNIFLSSSGDGELRIYSILQAKPVITIQLQSGIRKSQWSSVHPLVVAVLLNDGHLHMYNIHASQMNPVETFMLNDEKVRGSVLCFNKINSSLLGIGCCNGLAQVWQLSNSLTTVESYDEEELKALVTLE